jgi:hypothetical protein
MSGIRIAMSLRKYYFVVVQLAIEIYLLPVSTANGIKFRFQLIKMSDRDLKFVYLNNYGI